MVKYNIHIRLPLFNKQYITVYISCQLLYETEDKTGGRFRSKGTVLLLHSSKRMKQKNRPLASEPSPCFGTVPVLFTCFIYFFSHHFHLFHSHPPWYFWQATRHYRSNTNHYQSLATYLKPSVHPQGSSSSFG